MHFALGVLAGAVVGQADDPGVKVEIGLQLEGAGEAALASAGGGKVGQQNLTRGQDGVIRAA